MLQIADADVFGDFDLDLRRIDSVVRKHSVHLVEKIMAIKIVGRNIQREPDPFLRSNSIAEDRDKELPASSR